MNKVDVVALCMLSLIMTGCSTTQVVDDTVVVMENKGVSEHFFHVQDYALPKVVSVEELFTLSSSQQQHFLDYYFAPENADERENVRLFNYIEQFTDEFDFMGDTLTATQTMSQLQGNCMSLAILTKALADLVNLDVAFQRVNSAPVYQRFGDVMTLSSHVRTKVYRPETKEEKNKKRIVFVRSSVVIDYFPRQGNVKGKHISEAEFIAMYYRNMASDALKAKQFDRAFGYLYQAQNVFPNDPETLNTLAVLYRMQRKLADAEAVYQYIIEHTSGSVNALSNYAYLLEIQGQFAQAQSLYNRQLVIEDDNPYRWIGVAKEHFERGNLSTAIRFYKQAIEVAPYLHEGYFGLAKSYFAKEQLERAEKALKRAVELAYVPKDKTLYQAKLRLLESDDSEEGDAP